LREIVRREIVMFRIFLMDRSVEKVENLHWRTENNCFAAKVTPFFSDTTVLSQLFPSFKIIFTLHSI